MCWPYSLNSQITNSNDTIVTRDSKCIKIKSCKYDLNNKKKEFTGGRYNLRLASEQNRHEYH